MAFWEILLTLIFFLLPNQLGRHFWFNFSHLFGIKIDYLAPTVFLQDLLILLLIITKKDNLLLFLKKRKNFFFLFLFSSLNILFSLCPWVSLFAWLKIFEFLFFAIIISQNKQKAFKIFLRTLPLLVFFEFFLSLFQMVKGSSLNGFFWYFGERKFNLLTPGIAKGDFFGRLFLRPYGTFSHPNSLAGFFLVVFCFLAANIKSLNFLGKISLPFCFLLIFFSFSQIAWLCLGFVILAIFFKKFFLKLFSFKKLIFPIFVLISLFPLLLNKKFPQINSIEERSFLLQSSFKLISRYPLLGVGLNNFIIGLAKQESFLGKKYLLQPVHNLFFLVISEIGILGFLLLFFLVRKNFKNKKPSLPFLSNHSLEISLFIVFFTGAFDHYWLTLIQNQLLFFLLIGFCL